MITILQLAMNSLTSLLLLACLAATSALELASVYSPEELSKTDDSILEDAILNFTQLATKYGYPSEQHTVTTKDGYMLTLHRIPYGRDCGEGKGKPPVLVMHGLFCSADDFIVLGPQSGLAYVLADQCYDVWIGNNRGNKYSRKHVKMDTKHSKFWEFSWHEMGEHDLPAFVDHILSVTGEPSVHYVAHSQGSTQFFVFGSLHPDYHKKIRSAHALSPVAFMKNIDNLAMKILSIFHKPLHQIASLVGVHEFLPTNQFLNMIGRGLCRDEYPAFQAICQNVLFLIAGSNAELLNMTMLPVIIGHTPAGASSRQLVHFAQGILHDGFKQYDHGFLGNLLKYGSGSPPSYKLDKINIPIAMYYSSNDVFSSVRDVDHLSEILPNVIGKYRIPHTRFSHLDYLWGADVKRLVYNQLLNILKRY